MTSKEVTVSEFISMITETLRKMWEISSPILILKNCIRHEEWFKGVVLSTAFLEGIGVRVLSGHFKGNIAPEKFEHIRSVAQIIVLLYASGIINQSTYSKMIEVNEFRNDLVHIEPYTPQRMKPEKAKKIIKKAITCLKVLLEKWPSPKVKEIKMWEVEGRPQRN